MADSRAFSPEASLARLLLATAIVASALPAVGCDADPEREVLVSAFQATTTALAAEDWPQLWALSDAEAQQDVLSLHRTLMSALALVDRVYPPETREEARRALGAELVASISVDDPAAGPALLGRMLTGRTVDLSEGATDGRNASSVSFDGELGFIHTSAGEKYGFVKTADGWRSRLLGELLREDGSVAALRESAAAVVLAEEELRAAWIASRDPRTPQGAYNLARAAAAESPPNAATLFALLDAPARAALATAMETARSAQKLVQRRTTKRQRKAGYEEAGLTRYVDIDSDRSLYLAWAASPEFQPPLKAVAAPRAVEGDLATGKVTVVTVEGELVPMVLEPDAIWRLAGAAAAIEKALVAPAAAAIEKLSAP